MFFDILLYSYFYHSSAFQHRFLLKYFQASTTNVIFPILVFTCCITCTALFQFLRKLSSSYRCIILLASSHFPTPIQLRISKTSLLTTKFMRYGKWFSLTSDLLPVYLVSFCHLIIIIFTFSMPKLAHYMIVFTNFSPTFPFFHCVFYCEQNRLWSKFCMNFFLFNDLRNLLHVSFDHLIYQFFPFSLTLWSQKICSYSYKPPT